MEIKDHLLVGDNIEVKATPKTSGKFKDGLPDTLIIHYTAGASAESSIRTLLNPLIKASAHLVIGQKGEVTQLAPFDTITWHAGRSSWQGRKGLNRYSIGIEIDNAGELKKAGNEYVSWFGRRYPESEVIKAVHRNRDYPGYWHTYTREQIETVDEICRLLVEQYGITQILGHEEIAPRRKTDPGPAFPLDKMRQRIFDNRESEEEETIEAGVVTASTLNIRQSPDGESDKVAKALPKGTEVKILEEKDGWYKVETSVEGWVYGKYIQEKS